MELEDNVSSVLQAILIVNVFSMRFYVNGIMIKVLHDRYHSKNQSIRSICSDFEVLELNVGKEVYVAW